MPLSIGQHACQRLPGRPALRAPELKTALRQARPSKRPRCTVAAASEGSTVTFLGAGNQSMEVHCPPDSYILDAGLDAGLELPYTCRGGICGACVGRVVKGEVDQSDVEDLAFTLDEGDIERGMALLCQSRPVGDVTIETQSDWGYSLGMAEWKGATGVIAGKKPDSLTPWEK
ncbi:hypothetical protein WJX74_005569 [Apatococcus lobatus]|uniref:2Fe-2S ferredoxin-type domain-containing protein n=1 Tax=Apatococcus lobatus TaxID=904363 RepID=A0AAW1QW83_9CHLO